MTTRTKRADEKERAARNDRRITVQQKIAGLERFAIFALIAGFITGYVSCIAMGMPPIVDLEGYLCH